MKYFFLLLFPTIFLAQDKKIIKNLKVDYEFLYNIENSKKVNDSLVKFSKNKANDKLIKEMNESMIISQKLIFFEMIANSDQSIFYRKNILLNDELSPMKKIFIENINKVYLYSNKKTNEYYSQINFSGQDLLLDINSKELVKYEYINETKFINDLECFKVKILNLKNSSLICTAWYCPSIVINGGPEFCYDLPGLVLEINYKNHSIVCKNIMFNINDEYLEKLKKPKGSIITREELALKINIAKGNKQELRNVKN
jgi:GLPGLI family protein